MKSRMWIGMIILLVFLISGILISALTDRICQPITQNLQKAGDLAAAGLLESAGALTVQAAKQWESHWHQLALVADHSPMDEIDGLFAQAKMYARVGASQDFSAVCAKLSKLVTAISEAHSLTWWNLI